MKAVNLLATSLEDLATQLKQAINDGFRPTLAFAFVSVVYDLDALAELLTAHNLDICGATTSGEIQDTRVYEDHITVMLTNLPANSYKILMHENEAGKTFEVAQALTKEAEQTFEESDMIIFSSGTHVDGEQIINGIRQTSQKGINFYGGLAGDNLVMNQTFTFTQGKRSPHALLAVVFDRAKVTLKGISTSGWKPVGTEKIVTKSEGNVVYSIDGQTAIEAFEKYFGLGDVKENDVAAVIGVRFPLQLIRPDGTSVLRAPLISNKENGSMIFAGSVPEGASVRFSTVPDFEVIEETIAHVQEFQPEIPEADALFMFSCAARKLAFGPMIDDEIQGIQQIWNKPLAGFFCYGEIGAVRHALCDFHNETISLVVMKEK